MILIILSHKLIPIKIMKINWTILIGLAIVILVLICFLIRKNNKDKKDYTDFLNQDFKKQEEQESDLNDESY
ncbi:hypothetical protein K5V07_06215 [Flavobacterium sp. CHNK8]|uniref:hypothetical protein n=2 Tax=Flavobacterium TaxID=237 RepID=UPI001C8E191F|nr:hypothetical protein [Flavobacterium sp. CHNK8]QZK91833.1 hypothetical protein K5V07_06215 [Flavobacterium sp. CHNK8]